MLISPIDKFQFETKWSRCHMMQMKVLVKCSIQLFSWTSLDISCLNKELEVLSSLVRTRIWVQGFHSTNLVTSFLSLSSLDAKLMSMNSVSVYIWRPPLMVASIWNSSLNSLPALFGLAFKAASTSSLSDWLSGSAEMIVIFSSLLRSWYNFWYLSAMAPMNDNLLFSARISKNLMVSGWKVATL